jgi:hypothetical protein
MATIPPNVVGLFPAKRLEVDLEKRELSLVGEEKGSGVNGTYFRPK